MEGNWDTTPRFSLLTFPDRLFCTERATVSEGEISIYHEGVFTEYDSIRSETQIRHGRSNGFVLSVGTKSVDTDQLCYV